MYPSRSGLMLFWLSDHSEIFDLPSFWVPNRKLQFRPIFSSDKTGIAQKITNITLIFKLKVSVQPTHGASLGTTGIGFPEKERYTDPKNSAMRTKK